MNSWVIEQIDVASAGWGELIRSQDHLIFHEPVWADITREGLGGIPLNLGFYQNEKLMGGLVGFQRQLLWAKMAFMSVPYGGVIGQVPSGHELFNLLNKFAKNHGLTRMRIVDSPGLRPTPCSGFDRIAGNSHVLTIGSQTFDEIWIGFKKAIRRDVRLAERNGLLVEMAANQTNINEFYELYLQAMCRNRAIPKYGREFVQAIYQYLILPGKAAILLARKDGIAVAGILLIDSATCCHYLMAGSMTEALRYCPNDLLLNAAIRRAIERKMQSFDFMGSSGEDPALDHFKAKWGAEPVPVNTLDLIARPGSMRLWNAAYRVAQTSVGRRFINRIRQTRRHAN